MYSFWVHLVEKLNWNIFALWLWNTQMFSPSSLSLSCRLVRSIIQCMSGRKRVGVMGVVSNAAVFLSQEIWTFQAVSWKVFTGSRSKEYFIFLEDTNAANPALSQQKLHVLDYSWGLCWAVCLAGSSSYTNLWILFFPPLSFSAASPTSVLYMLLLIILHNLEFFFLSHIFMTEA